MFIFEGSSFVINDGYIAVIMNDVHNMFLIQRIEHQDMKVKQSSRWIYHNYTTTNIISRNYICSFTETIWQIPRKTTEQVTKRKIEGGVEGAKEITSSTFQGFFIHIYITWLCKYHCLSWFMIIWHIFGQSPQSNVVRDNLKP